MTTNHLTPAQLAAAAPPPTGRSAGASASACTSAAPAPRRSAGSYGWDGGLARCGPTTRPKTSSACCSPTRCGARPTRRRWPATSGPPPTPPSPTERVSPDTRATVVRRDGRPTRRLGRHRDQADGTGGGAAVAARPGGGVRRLRRRRRRRAARRCRGRRGRHDHDDRVVDHLRGGRRLPGSRRPHARRGPVRAAQPIGAADGVTVSAAVYALPEGEGNPWSQWGQGVVLPDGRFVSALGDHLGRDGNSWFYEFDPTTNLLTRTAEVAGCARPSARRLGVRQGARADGARTVRRGHRRHLLGHPHRPGGGRLVPGRPPAAVRPGDARDHVARRARRRLRHPVARHLPRPSVDLRRGGRPRDADRARHGRVLRRRRRHGRGDVPRRQPRPHGLPHRPRHRRR